MCTVVQSRVEAWAVRLAGWYVAGRPLVCLGASASVYTAALSQETFGCVWGRFGCHPEMQLVGRAGVPAAHTTCLGHTLPAPTLFT